MIPEVTDPLNAGLSALFNDDAVLCGATGPLAPGKAWRAVAPDGEARVTVLWNIQSAPDKHTFGGGGCVPVVVLVKATKIGKDDDGLAAAYGRAHALITGAVPGATLVVAGLTVMGAQRFNSVNYDETNGEFTAWHVGGEYRVWLSV